ncbi:MAG: amidohydrolase family protein [Planctomycetota bacterium]
MELDYNEKDALVFKEEFEDFLPGKVFDCHIHMFDKTCFAEDHEFPEKSCYRKFDQQFSIEQCLAYAEKMFPERDFYTNSFGHPDKDTILDASGRYTGSITDNKTHFGMALISPHDKIEDIKKRVLDNKLIGYKPYLNFVDWKDSADIEIFDILPEEQMDFANEKKLAMTLHIPRRGRLGDPVNQKQMVEICTRYPDVQIIFAHIGRAYYLKNVIGFLDCIKDIPNAFIDTAMVNHEGVLEYTFNNYPREKILFGSDAPIAMMKGKSVEINNQYAYLMAEDYRIGTAIYDTENTVEFTSFFYEQLRGIKLAAERAGLSRSEIDAIFFDNSHKLFRETVNRVYGS